MSEAEFVDTNIVVYAHDVEAAEKRTTCKALLADLALRRAGVVSTQVLAEFWVVVRHRWKKPMAPDQALGVLAELAAWRVVLPDPGDVIAAAELQLRRQLHFWDALLVTAARKAGAPVLWTEDMQHGARFGELEIRNPLFGALPMAHER